MTEALHVRSGLEDVTALAGRRNQQSNAGGTLIGQLEHQTSGLYHRATHLFMSTVLPFPWRAVNQSRSLEREKLRDQ
jgi:hypothetical protein